MARLNGCGMWGVACAMVYGLLLTPAVSAQTPQYTVVELTVGNTTSSTAYDINASGQVVGQAQVDGPATRAILWADGTLTDLGSLNGTYNAAYGISDNTNIVGWSSYSFFRAFIWNDGKISDLSANVSVQTMAYAVNDSGTAVGQINSGPGSRTTAVVWQNGTMVVLPTLSTSSLRNDNARDINAGGQIVGMVETRAALWQNGTVTELGTLGGNSSAAFGINDSGHIVGQAQLPSAAPTYGRTRAFLWKNGTMTNPDVTKTQATLGSASRILVKTCRVASLAVRRSRRAPPGRTICAARLKRTNRSVWIVWSTGRTVRLRVGARRVAPVSI